MEEPSRERTAARGPESAGSPFDMEQLVWQEIGGAARVIARYRFALVGLISLFVVPLLAYEPRAWVLWVYVGASTVLGAVLVWDAIRLRDAPVSPKQIPYFVGTVVLFHTVLIGATGGAESPFLVLYVVMGIVPPMSIGRPRPALSLTALPVTLLWLLTIGAAQRWLPDLRPEFLGGAHAAPRSALFLYTQAFVMTVASLAGGSVVLVLRAAIERTARSAVRMRHELVASMRERNEELVHLGGEIAHELKNPLATIRGLSALVERKLEQGSKEKEQMGVLVAEVRRMGTILDEFLNFSRPATGLSARPVDPAELARDVVALHEGVARLRGVELALATARVGAVYCDPRKVKQVLVNLVQNAIDAAPRGGRVRLELRAGPGANVTLLVEDTGPGLAAEVRHRLFEPGATTKSGGSGLGLTIARAIAEQHGGSLELADRAAGGCRATLVLPTTPPTPAEPGRGDE